MSCLQKQPGETLTGFDGIFGYNVPIGPYASEAECLEACKEGACCDANFGSCNIRPACQCKGTGKTFKGVGTTCATGTCNPLP